MTTFATNPTKCRTMWSSVAAKLLLGLISIFCALGSIECGNCTIPAICSCQAEQNFTVPPSSISSQAAESLSQNSFNIPPSADICKTMNSTSNNTMSSMILNCTYLDPKSNATVFPANSTKEGQFQLTLKYPCPDIPIPPSSKHGYSTGSVLLILFFTALFSYLILGMTVNFCIMGARGIEVIPNLEFWRNLPSLVKDGVVFVQNGFRVPPTENYTRSPESYDAI